MNIFNNRGEHLINTDKPYPIIRFSEAFNQCFNRCYKNEKNIIILCIGTDRSTGDCLGPLVGYKLQWIKHENLNVFGTLEEPVHAKNLDKVIKKIEVKYEDSFIIAVDACLGKASRIGCINIGEGSLRPGSGVNKELQQVGQMHILGIVNLGGFMEYLILQNTRLNIVMKIADIISLGLQQNINRIMLARES